MRRWMIAITVIAGAGIIAAGCGTQLGNGSAGAVDRSTGAPPVAAEPEQIPVGHTAGYRAPDFRLPAIGGNEVALNGEEEQRTTVLVFWATWCPHCVNEIPAVNDFVRRHGDVRLLSVNVDRPGSDVAGFAAARSISYPVLRDDSGATAQAYGVQGIPHVVVVDRTGIIRYTGHSVSGAEDAVKKLAGSEA